MAPQRPKNRVQPHLDMSYPFRLKRDRFGRLELKRPRLFGITNALKSLFLPKDMNWMQRQTFESYLMSRTAIEHRQVSGDPRLQPRSSSLASDSAAALLDWIVELISLGFSLGGDFLSANFVIDEGGCLKGDSELYDCIVIATNPAVEADFDRLALVISDEIYQGAVVPPDVAHLINVLHDTAYALHNIPLLKMHATRETDIGKSQLYGRIFNQMEVIKEVDEDKYARIMANLTPCLDWIINAMHNIHLQRVLRYKNNKPGLFGMLVAFLSNDVNYEESAESQMVCRRNGEAHLPKDYRVNAAGMLIALEAALQTMLDYNECIREALNRTPNRPAHAPLGSARSPTAAAFKKADAIALATVIVGALAIDYESVEVAREAVEAAIDRLLSSPVPTDAQAIKAAEFAAAAAAASAVARLYPGPPYPPKLPFAALEMFEQDDVDLMFSLVNPGLLPELQKSMYDEGELRGSMWSGRSRIVRLPPVVPPVPNNVP